jgi:O-acetyl-ADP-ribose deacetylase (regulator of RNase III)
VALTVIHAVGPKWYEAENKKQALLKVYANILEVADELLQVKTLSIPTISTGIHKYPAKFAAEVVLPYLVEKLSACKNLERIIIVCGNHENALAYQEVAAQLPKGEVQVIDLMPCDLQI